jgi:hypothetical protein
MARDNEAQPKTVRGIIPLELICVVDIVDGKNNKIPSMILVRAKGANGAQDNLFTLLPEGSEKNMRRPAKWLTDALQTMLERLDASRKKVDKQATAAMPDDMSMPLPQGTPEV